MKIVGKVGKATTVGQVFDPRGGICFTIMAGVHGYCMGNIIEYEHKTGKDIGKGL